MTTNATALHDAPDAVLIAFGNQLFHPRHLPSRHAVRVLLVEDPAMCRRYA
jgi:hypothetical protein